MKRSSTIPALRATCETCGATFENRSDYTERVERARAWAIDHARTERHCVFVEKITGTQYDGTRR